MILLGTVFGSTDSTSGAILGLWDYKIPSTERFFLSALGSIGYYPRQRAYTQLPGQRQSARAGTNDSDKDNYIEESGTDNWWKMKLEYVFPIGSMRNTGSASYKLKNRILVSGASGGDAWNPLTSGATILVFRQFNRYQEYETDQGNINGTIHPVELGLLYNNTDFYPNPSRGSSQYLWNSIGETSWLRWLKMDWMQVVGFVEGGRVDNEYNLSSLFSDWKADVGLGVRAMMAGGVVRFDVAVSEEGASAWVMFGHPF